jgi:hypothetical protein
MCESYIFEIKLRQTFLDLDPNVNFSVLNIKNFLTMAFLIHVWVCYRKGLVLYLAEWKVSSPPPPLSNLTDLLLLTNLSAKYIFEVYNPSKLLVS